MKADTLADIPALDWTALMLAGKAMGLGLTEFWDATLPEIFALIEGSGPSEAERKEEWAADLKEWMANGYGRGTEGSRIG